MSENDFLLVHPSINQLCFHSYFSMSTNQHSVSSGSLEYKKDTGMGLDENLGKNEVKEVCGLEDETPDEGSLITLFLIDREKNPVFRNEKKVEFTLTQRELSLSRVFFPDVDKNGKAITHLQDFEEAVPITMSWAKGEIMDFGKVKVTLLDQNINANANLGQILEQYDRETRNKNLPPSYQETKTEDLPPSYGEATCREPARHNDRLYSNVKLVTSFNWKTTSTLHFGEYRNDVDVSLGVSGAQSFLTIAIPSFTTTVGEKNYVCDFLKSLGFGAEIIDPKPSYTTDDAVYAFSKCIEWLKHFNGHEIRIIGEIPGTKFITSLRSKNLEEECRGLDPRTLDQLAQNKMRKLVREKLLSEIGKLDEAERQMGEIKKLMDADKNEECKKLENKMIYNLRDKVEGTSPYIRWLDETLERTKQEEQKFFEENPPWFLKWIEEIRDNRTFTELSGVISCANWFGIKPLMYLTAAAISTVVRRKTKAKARATIEEMNRRTPPPLYAGKNGGIKNT